MEKTSSIHQRLYNFYNSNLNFKNIKIFNVVVIILIFFVFVQGNVITINNKLYDMRLFSWKIPDEIRI